MGAIRTFGLMFFMTLLIGGCMLAVANSPPPPPVTYSPPALHWDQAEDLIRHGAVREIIRVDASRVLLVLPGDVRYIVLPPDREALIHAAELCGAACAGLDTGNL